MYPSKRALAASRISTMALMKISTALLKQPASLKQLPSRTSQGHCDQHDVQVFATQIGTANAPDPPIG
jgi:hypothetical protein